MARRGAGSCSPSKVIRSEFQLDYRPAVFQHFHRSPAAYYWNLYMYIQE
jgi:hypothetical protein